MDWTGGTADASAAERAAGFLIARIPGSPDVLKEIAVADMVFKDAAGNVGIGTDSPGAKLDVRGIAQFFSGASGSFNFIDVGRTTSQARVAVAAASGDFVSGAAVGDALFYNPTASNAWFGVAGAGSAIFTTNSTERMRINSAGFVGIGTGSPTVKLDISDADAANSALRVTNSIYGVTVRLASSIGVTDRATLYTEGAHSLGLGTNNTERMRIDSGGSVGIGTASPQKKFVVSDAGAYGMELSPNDAGGAYNRFINYDRAANVYRSVQYEGENHRFATGTSGNTERMRIDSAGRVGIGTSAPSTQLHLAGTGEIKMTNAANTVGFDIGLLGGGSDATGFIYQRANAPLAFGTNNDTRMTISGSGNVGIGTSSPTAGRLVVDSGASSPAAVFNSTSDTYIQLQNSGANGLYLQSAASAAYLWNQLATPLLFGTNNTERARLDGSGNLLVGTTTASDTSTANGLVASGAFPGYIISRRVSGAGQAHVNFVNGGSSVGSIVSSTTATTYNTSSDYRLKDIDGPITDSGAYIDALKPVQGSWKADGSRFIGLLAHEVQEVSETPIATGEKDGEEMQAMDYSAPEIIANLIAEIQSLRARVAQLEGN